MLGRSCSPILPAAVPTRSHVSISMTLSPHGNVCLRKQTLSQTVPLPQIAAFVDQFTVDEYFPRFKDFCSNHGIPLVILSDGLDFYVERILNRNGLGDCKFFANNLGFINSDGVTKLQITFPYTDSECQFCGNCKRNHMLTLSGDDDIIVYVGDGISDRCPVGYADIVFAKKDLIQYCQRQNITYFEYANFQDVQQRLEMLLAKKRLRKRREAEMARRDVFMQG